jgi:hypothetical protein
MDPRRLLYFCNLIRPGCVTPEKKQREEREEREVGEREREREEQRALINERRHGSTRGRSRSLFSSREDSGTSCDSSLPPSPTICQ